MTGRDVMMQAMALLGYVDPFGDISGLQNGELFKRTVPILNQVLADVRHITKQTFALITGADDVLPVDEDTVMRAVVPGVCMYLAQAEGDGTNQALFAATYEQARGSLKTPAETIVDTLPKPC